MQIKNGAFAGFEATLVADLGDLIEVDVSIFGRVTRVKVGRADVLLDDSGIRASLWKDIERDHDRLAAREEMHFWRELVGVPEDAEKEIVEFEAHRASCAARARARLAELRPVFDAIADEELAARLEAERAIFFPDRTEAERLKAAWKADPSSFDRDAPLFEAARERAWRAHAAGQSARYLAWRRERWSADECERRQRAADDELASLWPRVSERVERELGLVLPDELYVFARFLRGLQPSEREGLEMLHLNPFGILDLLETPDARCLEGCDLRVHGRFYRDPPEMLTFLHGGDDGLHYGLFFDDGRRSSGVVHYYNNDGVDLAPPRGTPLQVVREHIEHDAEYDEAPGSGWTDVEKEERLFSRALLRDAVARFETGDRKEVGAEYRRRWIDGSGRADASRLATLDGGGAVVRGETVVPRDEALREPEHEALRHMIWKDPVALAAAVAEAERRLDAGDPAEALCLGRDLHWCGGNSEREAWACDLLARAYRALGRESLARIAEAHREHRHLSSVGVLERA